MKMVINQDVRAGKWKQFRGKVMQWWGKLTKNRLSRIRGYWEEFVGLVQERYGNIKAQIEKKMSKPAKHIKSNGDSIIPQDIADYLS